MQPLLLCERKHNEASLTTTGPVFSYHVSFEQFIPLTPGGKRRYKGHRSVQHLLCADEGTADVSRISQHGGRAHIRTAVNQTGSGAVFESVGPPH